MLHVPLVLTFTFSVVSFLFSLFILVFMVHLDGHFRFSIFDCFCFCFFRYFFISPSPFFVRVPDLVILWCSHCMIERVVLVCFI